jgi:hypothetical protein
VKQLAPQPGMEELIQFSGAHCGQSVTVQPEDSVGIS